MSKMDRGVSVTIDRQACIGCGLCVEACPSQTLSLVEGKAAVTGDQSLGCGHCAAVCPVGAITVGVIDEEQYRFASFQADDRWLPHGRPEPAGLVRLMASRRSCRKFKNTPLDLDILEDLVKIGITAPSGSNCQLWTFTLVPTRPAVEAFGGRVALFFERLNNMAERKALRTFLKLIGKPALDNYYRDYYDEIREALAEREISGRDLLFHGAPAVIVVGSAPGASCPGEDALLACQNILLGAHALGLGTCLIGFAVEAMTRDPKIKSFLGAPRDETVHAVIAVGRPDEEYQWITGRKKPLVRVFEPEPAEAADS
ncbi:MAG: nitroreductase family protein [Pseudomonadota bacterium]